MAFKRYKVLTIAESGCSTLFFGSAGLPVKTLEDTLNEEAADGWECVFMAIEKKRYLLFWSREVILLTLGHQ